MTPPAPIRAALVGALHGVVEWLPVSSSGHVALLIDAADWPEADATRRRERRALEVALHTGSLLPLGARVAADVRAAPAPASLVVAGVVATGITSVIGATLGEVVEARFAGPRSVAAGLAAGSLALVLAERRATAPAEPTAPNAAPRGRALAALRPADVVAVGAAQGLAIWPGVSRRAATVAAARARGLDPAAASALSWATGLSTLAAATTWQFWRARDDLRAAPVAPLAGALTSAAVGTATRALPARTAGWPAAVWAAWRLALAAATLERGTGGPGKPTRGRADMRTRGDRTRGQTSTREGAQRGWPGASGAQARK